MAGALSVLALAAALVFGPAAWADSQVRIVRLSLVSGPVQIDRATGQGFEKAIMNMPIAQGTKLWTQGASRAEVEFEDGTTMRLTPGSKIEFERLALLSSGAKASTIRVEEGSLYLNLRNKGKDDFRISFAGQQLELTRAAHFRLDLRKDQAELAVFSGELPLGERKVKKNQTASLDLNGKETYELAKGITPGPYDEWDTYRMQYDSAYASAGSNRVPYYYGRSDLNYYGSWGYVPGYGDLWRPFGVSYGWDPFGNGAWSWYPGWGYTWVSTYPWGWTPYRYGSWVWVSNYGWCWQPGGYTGWYPVPHVVGAPPAYQPPAPPPAPPVAGGLRPTVIVTNSPGPTRGRLPARYSDGNGPVLNPNSAGTPVAAAGASVPATTGNSAPGTTAAAQPARPVRTFVPKSGPGLGRRPVPLDEAGIPTIRGVRNRTAGDSARPGSVAPPRPGFSQPAASHRGGMRSAAPRVSPPAAPRTSPPRALPRSSPAPSAPANRVKD
jgi:hypothetical protein